MVQFLVRQSGTPCLTHRRRLPVPEPPPSVLSNFQLHHTFAHVLNKQKDYHIAAVDACMIPTLNASVDADIPEIMGQYFCLPVVARPNDDNYADQAGFDFLQL